MKNLPSLFHRAALAVVGALALGACSRGQYAVLPKAPAYLGAAPVATAAPRPAARPQLTTVVASTAEAPEAVAAPAPKPIAATAPVTQPAAATPVASVAPVTAPEVAAPAKPSLAQRLVLKKLTRKMDKLTSRVMPQLKQRDATASTDRAGGGLRQALVLGVIGLAIILLAALVNSNFVYVIGAIVLIVALVLLLLYLIDQL